jgi:SAM-dependent methyltransferase
MSDRSMRDFWDARAREDAYFFVDNRLRYGDPDLDEFWAGGEEVVDRILETLGADVEAGDRVIDIGCGIGRLTRALAGRGAEVVAIDVSPEMIERARDLNRDLDGVEWIAGDGRTLEPIAGASADAILSFVVFQHVPDPEITLGYVREMGRVLKPGGWAAFQISDLPEVHQRPSLPQRLTGGLRRAFRGGPKGQDHPAWRGSAVPLERLRAVAAEVGLDTERVAGEGTQHCLVLLRRRGT